MRDQREHLPAGLSLEEYAEQIIARMPCSLTYRETWALMEYIKKYLPEDSEGSDFW